MLLMWDGFCEESGAYGVWCLIAALANCNVASGCYDVGLMLLHCVIFG